MPTESTPPGRTGPIAIVAVAIVLALLLSACGKGGADQGHGGMPPTVVTVSEVKAKTVPVEFEYPAQTAGSREVEVRARVTGILVKRNYVEGERVNAGQSLFQLDAAPYEAAAARAEADVAAAEARAGQAGRNAKRYKPLFEAKAASQKDLDDAVSAEEVANAEVKAARARLNEAKLNLAWTRVEAPISGLTSRSLKSEGSLVSGPDVLLTTVTQSDPIYVNFGLSQAELTRLRADIEAGKLVMPNGGKFDVAVRMPDGKVLPRTGKLVYQDSRVSQTTGTADARAEIANPDGAVRPGQFVRAILKGATRPDAIVVPQRAVMEGPQGKIVYTVVDGKAAPRPVTVGEWSGEEWVVTSGLKAGEKIITEGLMKVYPGAPVQVGAPNAAPPGAPPAPAKADAKPEAKK